jgi:FixJ family two-component response regulator
LIDLVQHENMAELFSDAARIDGGAARNLEISILASGKAVFVVDDDPGMLRSVKRLLREHGFTAVLFDSAEAFQRQANLDNAFCLILDVNLNDGSGIELGEQLARRGISVPVIFITGNASEATRKAAMASGCSAFLTKPFPAQSLLAPIQKAAAALA